MFKIISLGGSLMLDADGPDIEYLKKFTEVIRNHLDNDPKKRLIIVTGGGNIARKYQEAFRNIRGIVDHEEEDSIGIAVTRVNAQLLKSLLKDHITNAIITNPNLKEEFTSSQLMIASGWKPGFSTDYVAVTLATKYGAKAVINLSNIKKVYDKDPKKLPDAIPKDIIKWDQYINMVGTVWTPGLSTPFDPIASKLAKENNIKVSVSDGKNLENFKNILANKMFEGTILTN